MLGWDIKQGKETAITKSENILFLACTGIAQSNSFEIVFSSWMYFRCERKEEKVTVLYTLWLYLVEEKEMGLKINMLKL